MNDDEVRVGVIGHGGLLRAFSFARPKGVMGMSRGVTPGMVRQPETWVSLSNLMLKLHGISHSSAILESNSPQSNNNKGNSIHPT